MGTLTVLLLLAWKPTEIYKYIPVENIIFTTQHSPHWLTGFLHASAWLNYQHLKNLDPLLKCSQIALLHKLLLPARLLPSPNPSLCTSSARCAKAVFLLGDGDCNSTIPMWSLKCSNMVWQRGHEQVVRYSAWRFSMNGCCTVREDHLVINRQTAKA